MGGAVCGRAAGKRESAKWNVVNEQGDKRWGKKRDLRHVAGRFRLSGVGEYLQEELRPFVAFSSSDFNSPID